MTVGRAVEIRALAWNEGEEPVEIYSGGVEGSVNVEHKITHALETKEYAKLVRYYPSTTHPPMAEGLIVLHYRAFTDPFRGRQMVGGTDVADMNKRFEELKQFCTQPVFSPEELYALKPTRVDYGSWHTVNVHLSNEVNY